ncbi:hypothetical protein MMC31_007134 [Peltigera leucophlebia]|nr:hypothetical protein [Peltigera leucophlebia]
MVTQDSDDPKNDINTISRIRKRRQSWLNDFLPEERWIDTVKATSNYLADFEWERSFWQPTNGSQTMHVLSTQVIKKTDYWMVRICIIDIDRTKLKTGLKTTGILGDAWSTSCIEPVISVSANPEFVHSRITLMSEDDSKAKAKALSVYKDSIFPFMYDVRTTDPGKFSDPGLCDVSNFWPETKVAVELQIHSRNFKTKGQERNLGYSFKLIRLYKLQDVKILPPSTPEKRQKEANKFIATPPRTKNTRSALNPLEWIVDRDGCFYARNHP